MKINQTTPVDDVVEPVSMDDLRNHLRIEHDADDAYLIALASAARTAAENHIDTIIAAREYLMTLDEFPAEIEIPLAPVQSTSIDVTYYDTAGQVQTFELFDFYRVNDSLFLVPDSGRSWPATQSGKDRVMIAFTAGWADTPKDVKHAILMIASTLYDQRRDVTAQTMNLVPMSSQYLLEPYRRTVI